MSNLPILSLDELLNKEIALSYYLDYLSILNLQKYVIFYLTAQGTHQFIVQEDFISKKKLISRMENYFQSLNARFTSKQNKSVPRRNSENFARKGTEHF